VTDGAPVFAHSPHFPTRHEPIEIPKPEAPKANYPQRTPGLTVTFTVTPSERQLPIQMRMPADNAGHAAQFTATNRLGMPTLQQHLNS
jgi:hypothetical protein